MADSTINTEREQRKLYLRARQRMILSATIGFLVVVLIISLIGAFILRMDNREDNLIDVIVGSSFDDLIDTKKVPKAGSKIESLTNCEDAAQLKDVPQAQEHQAA